MEPALLGGMFALGIASGVHCVGMCGGIVTAFNVVEFRSRSSLFLRQLLFNAGRISSYAVAGAVAGTAGLLLSLQNSLYLFANVVLILVGLHLAGFGALLRLERLGGPLWRRLQPLAARASATGNPYFAGLLWGWLPCGLVYAALAISVSGGNAFSGSAAMLAFGLGTLPWLLAAGAAAAQLRRWMGLRAVRLAVGGGVMAFGVHGLL
jgi:sulfite exporter TauE/SafE